MIYLSKGGGAGADFGPYVDPPLRTSIDPAKELQYAALDFHH